MTIDSHRYGAALIAAVLLLGRFSTNAENAPASTEKLRVPIILNKPASLNVKNWPITFGVPFKRGEFRDVTDLTIVDQNGKSVPCQIVKTGDWEDGSVRWALADFTAQFDHQYFLARAARAEAKDDIKLQQSESDIVVETGGARYKFGKDAGCFSSIELDVDKDSKFAAGETLISDAGSAFYVIDSKNQRGVLRGKKVSVELAGKRHAVIRIDGDYVTDSGKNNAAGMVYFHFYAGLPWVRVSHKLIVTENTNQLWFKDIGLNLHLGPFKRTVTFNDDHAKPQSVWSQALGAKQVLTMLQDEYPHFGSTNSHFAIAAFAGDKWQPVREGLACGDWVDVSTPASGLAAQIPGFAEQFPKAFRFDGSTLTLKLWASEGGKELDYRTPQIIKSYFGHDWIPETDPCVKVPNAAQGTAKIHDFWLYPHTGPLRREISAQFGATREEIYASIDPAWVARSGVMGPIHPKDEKSFPRAEEVISDYFDRSVLAGDKIFPAQGYLYWGMYPYSAQPWELKNGRWYPTIHRLARSLEYNLKRGMWILYARSGERKYHDYARRYTRLCGNLLFSNHDSPAKPAGWMVQGNFHSPIVWGQFGGTDADKEFKHKMDGGAMCIAFASSEDVIQFVYDYFLTGDLHSRDMALLWKEAMIKEMNFDVDKALQFYPPEAFLRVLGSGYELDHDPRLLDYGAKIVKRRALCDGKNILNPDVPTNFGKEGEVFSAYYYYHVATGDPLSKKILVELAKFRYRYAQLDHFFSRSSPLQEAFAFAYRDTGDAIYADYAAQAASHYARNYETLNDLGIDFDKLNQATTSEWGHLTMTGQGPINVGIPAALRVASDRGAGAPYYPVSIKPRPTQRTHIVLHKQKPGVALLDVFVNNWGDRSVDPKLFDDRGKPAKLEIVERLYDRIDKPDCYSASSIWYNNFEDQIFYQLRIPASVGPGVYELDLGSEIEFAILRSDIDQIVQIAPQGTVLAAGRRYYFPLPKNTQSVEFFASRPARLFDPDGKEVAVEHIADARFRFETGGKGLIWGIEGGTDEFLRLKKGSVEAFVRIEKLISGQTTATPAATQEASLQSAALTTKKKADADAEGIAGYPLMLAIGDPKRLFEVNLDKFVAPTTEPNPAPNGGKDYVESKTGFGRAARLASHFVEVTRTGGSPATDIPHQRGTVEFWFRPMWSATDCHLIGSTFGSTIRTELYKAAPIAIQYFIDPDNGGRVERYNTAMLVATIEGIGATRCGVFFEANKWYHIALTWNIDGKNNDAQLFINGRKKALYHYDNPLPAKKEVAALKPPAENIRFGSAHLHGRIPTFEDYDELRISRSIRYDKDFEIPTAAFETDGDTYLLMHFDGNEEALANDKPAAGKWVRGKKM